MKSITNQQATSTNSSHSSSNLQSNESTTVAILQKELEWVHKIISLERKGLIQVKATDEKESPADDLQLNKSSTHFVLPIVSPQEAIFARIDSKSPQRRLQFRSISNEIRGRLTTGECSPGDGEQHTVNPATKNSDNTANTTLGNDAGALARFEGQGQYHSNRLDEENLLAQKPLIVPSIGADADPTKLEQPRFNSQPEYSSTSFRDEDQVQKVTDNIQIDPKALQVEQVTVPLILKVRTEDNVDQGIIQQNLNPTTEVYVNEEQNNTQQHNLSNKGKQQN